MVLLESFNDTSLVRVVTITVNSTGFCQFGIGILKQNQKRACLCDIVTARERHTQGKAHVKMNDDLHYKAHVNTTTDLQIKDDIKI